MILVITGCSGPSEDTAGVQVVETPEGWRLSVDGEPFYVKGAGGSRYLELLSNSGANAIRTWNCNQAKEILDVADEHGLKVMLGLWVAHERHGFDYTDEEAVKQQFDRFTEIVQTYRNHPALLLWGVGNEVGFRMQRPEVAEAVNEIIEMIHREDPVHPATTVTAGVQEEEILAIRKLIPSVDFVSVNSYGDIDEVANELDEYGYHGPYLITEWGPDGYWEVDTTDFGAPIEQSTNQKEEAYYNRYVDHIKGQKECMGSFVFLWGQKQERTHTWFGMFDSEGRPYGTVGAMEKAWNNVPFIMSSARIDGIRIDGQQFEPAQTVVGGIVASVEVEGDFGEDAKIMWELRGESQAKSSGGDPEVETKFVDWLDRGLTPRQALMLTPDTSGQFRLFVTIEQYGYLSSYNVPFSVIPKFQ